MFRSIIFTSACLFLTAIAVTAPTLGHQPKDAPVSQADIAKLIDDLGDPRFKVRDTATNRLLEIGEPALPLLTKAKDSPDEEIRERANRLIPTITRRASVAAAQRLMDRIGEGGLAGLVERMVKAKDTDSDANWQLLEELMQVIAQRAPAAAVGHKLGPPWKWTELPVDRVCNWNNRSGKRFLLAGLPKSPILLDGSIIVSDGPLVTITTISQSIIIIRGSLKDCSRLQDSLVICLGDFGGASVIESSVVVATGNFGGAGAIEDSLIVAGSFGEVKHALRSTVNPDDGLLEMLRLHKTAPVNPKTPKK